MSTGIRVNSRHLLAPLIDVSMLMPSGTRTVPLRFNVTEAGLCISCSAGCYYECTIKYDGDIPTANDMTVIYRDITAFFDMEAEVSLEFSEVGIDVDFIDTSITLPVGYSEVIKPDIPDIDYTDIDSQEYKDCFKALANLNLGELYAQQHAYMLYNDILVQKYPNIVAQARCSGLNLKCLLTPEFAKVINRFGPLHIGVNGEESIILRKGNALLVLPYKPVIDANNFSEYLADLEVVAKMTIGSYAKRLQNLTKINNRVQAKISIYETGLITSVNFENITTRASLGQITGQVKAVTEIPIALWLRMIKAFGEGTIEFLYGGHKICMRNQSLILVLRVPN